MVISTYFLKGSKASCIFFVAGKGIPELYYIKDRISQITYLDSSQYRNLSDIGVIGEIKGGIALYERTDICGEIEERVILKGVDACTETLKKL